MTAAFNLAQLANRTNTSGQLDAAAGLSGLVANANLASSGTASSSTFLRGDRTWASGGGGLSAATQAEAEAGTSNTVAITPLSLRQGLRASGSAPVFAPRAWVTFNGTGTVAILASGNVSSITDNGTGDYTLNFSTAMPDANYAGKGMGINGSNTWGVSRHATVAPTTLAFRIRTQGDGGFGDPSWVAVLVIR